MTTAREKDILSEVLIEEALTELDGWEYKQRRLIRHFTLASFAAAMELANAIAGAAEQMNHHPEMLIGFGKLRLQLYTHRFDAVTTKDVELARKVQAVARDMGVA